LKRASRERWLSIEVRHFAALAAVASEQSFRGAGKRLGYVQSAISRQIAYLEERTGARLIERSQGPKPVHLTQAGELILSYASDILETIDAAQGELGELHARGEEVRLGFFAGVATRLLPAALLLYGRRFPDVRIVAREAVTDGPLFDLVRRQGVDLAFAHLPPQPGPFATQELVRVPWTLVVRTDDPLAHRPAPPTLEEIARLPLIGYQSPRLEPWSDPRLRELIGEPRTVFRCEGTQTAQALARAGIGVALVPSPAVHDNDARLCRIELENVLPAVRMGLVWLDGRDVGEPVVQFRNTFAQVCTLFERSRADTRRNGKHRNGALNGAHAARNASA
jgi:DNA-binding transcriptional LysR family regulator